MNDRRSTQAPLRAGGRSTLTGESGMALIHAVLLIGLLAAVITAVSSSLIARAGAVRLAADRAQALYAAEAGVAAALAAGPAAPEVVEGRIGRGRYEARRLRRPDGRPAFRSVGACGVITRTVVVEGGGGSEMPVWRESR